MSQTGGGDDTQYNREESIYLDYNATTPLDKEVQRCQINAFESLWGNPSSNYKTGLEAKQAIAKARVSVARMINAVDSTCVIFTSGGTEGNNWIVHSCIPLKTSEKCHFLISNVEHDSVDKCVQHYVDLEPSRFSVTRFDPFVDQLRNLVRDDTRLVSCMLANNETGIIFPIETIVKELKEINREQVGNNLGVILFHTDASQAVGKIAVDVQALNVDFLTLTGHKFYGPRIGAIYTKDGVKLRPLFHGGGQEGGLRPGTQNTPLIVGLAKACDLVSENRINFEAHMRSTRDLLWSKLCELSAMRADIKVEWNFSARNILPNTLSLRLVGVKSSQFLTAFPWIEASTGAACHSGAKASPLLSALIGVQAAEETLRISVGRETTAADVQRFCDSVGLYYNMERRQSILNNP